MRCYEIKINYDNLKKVTSALLKNINNELKKGYAPNQKIALFYLKIDNKCYYYSYNFPDQEFDNLYNSYRLVEIKKAKRLLTEQLES